MEPGSLLPHSQEPATCPWPVPDQSTRQFYCLIHFNIILPSTPRSFKWCLSLRFPPTKTLYTPAAPHTCYMPRPSRFSLFDYQNSIWWSVQIIMLPVMQSSPVPCYFVSLSSKYLSQDPILENPLPKFLSVRDQVSCNVIVLENIVQIYLFWTWQYIYYPLGLRGCNGPIFGPPPPVAPECSTFRIQLNKVIGNWSC